MANIIEITHTSQRNACKILPSIKPESITANLLLLLLHLKIFNLLLLLLHFKILNLLLLHWHLLLLLLSITFYYNF